MKHQFWIEQKLRLKLLFLLNLTKHCLQRGTSMHLPLFNYRCMYMIVVYVKHKIEFENVFRQFLQNCTNSL